MTGEDILSRLHQPAWPDGAGPSVFDTAKPGESVCFVVSDHTRSTAVDRVLPFIVKGLSGHGCNVEDMFIIFATGIHRPPRPDEIARILGAAIHAAFRGRIVIHDPDDDSALVEVGRTSRGHPVRLNRRAMEADRLILTGAAAYHYHAGFGGGRKALVPGLASRDTVAHNHSLTLDPQADRIRAGVEAGRLDGNPVAEEMLESACLHPPDIIVNTVLSPAGELIDLFSGDLDTAHRAACRRAGEVCGVRIREKADFAIASAGNATNWIQSHKALYNASRAIRDDGRVILLAPCPEGLGNQRFRHWLSVESIPGLYRELRRSPEVNGQTALSTKERGRRTVLVTDLCREDTRLLGIETAPDLETAARRVLDGMKEEGIDRPRFYLMPHARHTCPIDSLNRA